VGWFTPRRVRKELLCPGCSDIVATAVHTRWPGNLVLTSPEGYRLQPSSAAVQIRQTQQQLRDAAPGDLHHAEDRLDFLHRHREELIYDLRCRRGHSVLRTAPQIVRAMHRTPGAWVSLTS
jgi:hypothetical protein